MMNMRWPVVLFSLLLGAASLPAAGQDYPNRPIRFVPPWPPGIEADARLRVLIGKLHERLGWTPVIEHKPGGNFIIATQTVSQAPADGYTILVAVSSMTIIPYSQRNLPFDFTKDFVTVTRFVNFPLALFANPSVPAKTLAELVAYSKANPGKLSYGITGTGGWNHLSAELLKRTAGVDMTSIPYKASSQLFSDVMGGTVPLAVTGATELTSQVQAGKLKMIVLLGAKRSPVFPDVPTAAESGLPGMNIDFDSWHGFMFRSGTPVEIVNRFHREIFAVLQLPEVHQQFVKLGGALPYSETPEQFRKKFDGDHARWGRVIREAGIKFE